MGKRIGAMVCTFAGHRWAPTDSAYVELVMLRCSRCDATSIVSAEMIETESYSEKGARAEMAENMSLDPRGFDSRLPRGRR